LQAEQQKSEVITARKLRVTYRQGRKTRINALNGVDFTIHEGDIFGLLGPNGAGKSTAMYCFLGLLQPNEGEVRVLDARPELGAAVFDDIAYLPEEPHYHPYLSVSEAVRYYADLYRRRITDHEVNAAIEEVGLGEFKRLRIAKCSKGMKQKVGIAACLLFTPRVIFLDEPTRGLDPIMVRQFRNHLLELNERGATIILNSHILSEVEMVCSRVAIIDRGNVIVDDQLNNLIHTEIEEYEIFANAMQEIPDYLMNVRMLPDSTYATIHIDHLEQFIGHCRKLSIRLQSCRLRTETLEDVFVRLVKEQKT